MPRLPRSEAQQFHKLPTAVRRSSRSRERGRFNLFTPVSPPLVPLCPTQTLHASTASPGGRFAADVSSPVPVPGGTGRTPSACRGGTPPPAEAGPPPHAPRPPSSPSAARQLSEVVTSQPAPSIYMQTPVNAVCVFLLFQKMEKKLNINTG